MNVLLALLSFLLVAADGGGLANLVGAVTAANPATVKAYWHTALPNSPIPQAILDLFTPSGDLSFSTGDEQKLGKISEYSMASDKKDTEASDMEGKQGKVFWLLPTKGLYTPNKYHEESTTNRKEPWTSTGDDQKLERMFFYRYDKGDQRKIHNLPSSSEVLDTPKKNNEKTTTNRKELKEPWTSTGDDQKLERMFFYRYDKGDQRKIHNLPSSSEVPDTPKKNNEKSTTDRKGERHEHEHGNGHDHFHSKSRDLFFFEDELRSGSVLAARVLSTTPRRPKLLHSEIADSVPFSSKNFTRILAMFAPASLAMADDIKLTLYVCDNPGHLNGEKRRCATSVESLVELATSTLETRDIRAISSDVPLEGMPSRRYKLTAVRKVSDSLKTMTCHDMPYPYMVFYCHMIYPSRAYLVTLASDDGSPPREAVAMCHLDTSGWDPTHAFFQLTHVKPGETTACHFVNRGTIVWAPVGNQGEVTAAAE